jgi:hypothetical protein
MTRVKIATLLCAAALLASSAQAATLHVPAEYPTIQAGIDAADYDDSVHVADGVFTGPGNRGISFRGKAITVRSESLDPTTCVIDCENLDRGFFFTNYEAETSILEGVTITRGYRPDDGGGGIECQDSRPTIRGCQFIANRAAFGGGIGCCSGAPVVSGCFFESNEALSNPSGPCPGGIGAGICAYGGDFHLTNCVFIANHAPNGGGACFLQGGAVVIGCSFIENVGGGLIRFWDGHLILRSSLFLGNQSFALVSDRFMDVSECTFVANHGPELKGYIVALGGLQLQNSILAFNASGITCYGATPTVNCCNVFGNKGGDWIGCLAGQAGANGNFSADPLFCDLEYGDFTLASDSPCLPGNHPDGVDCELIGALGQGCGTVAVQSKSWGAIKGMYRE